MNPIKKATALLALVCCLALPCSVRATEVQLSITKKYTGKISFALPESGTKTLLKLVKAGLERSGYFAQTAEQELIDKYARQDAAKGGVDFAAWKQLKVEILIRPEVNAADGQTQLSVELYHITQRDRIFAKRYTDKAGNEEAMAAFAVDDIIKSLTGEPGIENSRIVYCAETKPGKKEIFVTFPSGRDNKQITFDNTISLNPAWMNNGTKLLYTSYLATYPDIYFLDLTTGKRNKLVHFPGLNAQPATSPDGKTVALVLSKDGNPEIYTLSLETNKLTRVTNNKAVESSPTWSPDGRKIAYVSDRSGEPQIYIQSATGSSAERVSYVSNYCTSPDWSPKGDLIACSALDGDFHHIFVIDLKSKDGTQLTSGRTSYEDPSFAPGGRQLVITQSANYRTSLKILSVNDPKLIDLNVKGTNPKNPNWAR